MTRLPIHDSERFTTRRALAVSAAIIVLLSSHLGAGQTVVDDVRGFTLTLPDGFVPNPDISGAPPDIVHCFVLGHPTDDRLDITLAIEQMRSIIGRERLKPEHMPPGFQGRLSTTQWQGYVVDVITVPLQVGEIEIVIYKTQIPLKRRAIQVVLMGPADRESELQSLLAETLAGLKGESNWTPSAAPSSPATSSVHYGFILLAFAVVLVLGGLAVLWLVSRKVPKGVVLGIAAGIYVAGLSLAGIRLREIIMLSGALKMLGFTGGILGIVDLVRKRKPRSQVPRTDT